MSHPFAPTLRRIFSRMSLAFGVAVVLAACGGGSATTPTTAPVATTAPTASTATETPLAVIDPTVPPTTDAPKLNSATFAHSLGDQMEAVDPTNEFEPNQDVHLSLEFDGRPKTGVVKSQFFFGDDLIAEAEVNFADANSGVLFSIGEVTNTGFSLTHKDILPISKDYRAEVFLNDEPLGSYPFEIVPPSDAISSNITEVTLAQGATEDYQPIDPATEFTPQQAVYLVGSGDLGVYSWIQADWYEGGKLLSAGTRSITMQEDKEAVGFSFYFLPDGGWKEGKHEVALTLNGNEVGRYEFTVSETVAATPSSIQPTSLDNLTEQSGPNGIFTISVPEAWQFQDDSQSSAIGNSWIDSNGVVGVIINIYETTDTLTEEQLSKDGEDFVTKVFGSEDNFALNETTPQSDGSVLIGWTATMENFGEMVDLRGLTYIEQRGNKVSYLTAIFPAADAQTLWDNGMSTIVNSYKLNPDVAMP